MGIYVCKHFRIQELVPPVLYNQYKHDETKLWMLFDDRILKIIDTIRDLYGPMCANDWHLDGQYKERGIRSMTSLTGSILSQHKFGRAVDLKPIDPKIKVEAIRKDIISRKYDTLKEITCIEADVSWLHVDCRNYHGLLIVKP